VTHGLGVLDRLTTFEVEGPVLTGDGTGLATVGAGLRLTEGQGLLLQGGDEGALGQTAGSLPGHLLQGSEVEVGARAVLAEGTPGDDFAPPRGQCADGAEVIGVELAARHDFSCLRLGTCTTEAFVFPFYPNALFAAKQVLTS
jgi:hypothetical protein